MADNNSTRLVPPTLRMAASEGMMAAQANNGTAPSTADAAARFGAVGGVPQQQQQPSSGMYSASSSSSSNFSPVLPAAAAPPAARPLFPNAVHKAVNGHGAGNSPDGRQESTPDFETVDTPTDPAVSEAASAAAHNFSDPHAAGEPEEADDQAVPTGNLRSSTYGSGTGSSDKSQQPSTQQSAHHHNQQQVAGGGGDNKAAHQQHNHRPAAESSPDDLDSTEEEELWVRRSWLRDFTLENFQCSCCRRMAIDPLLYGAGDLVCRRCFDSNPGGFFTAEQRQKVAEAPAFIARAVLQLRNALQSAMRLEEAAEEERLRNVPKLDVDAALALSAEEQTARGRISVEWERYFDEIEKNHARRMRARQPGTSRQLKTEGDAKYETADYAAAYDCYSRAIDVNDGTQRLSGMYANRSAASFMLLRFRDAMNDCLKAIEIDPASGPKMWARCQKAALQLGELSVALQYADKIAEASGGRMTDEQRTERARLAQGAERLEQIENSKNVSASEREETYKLLMTRFPEAQHFRIKYCEEVMASGKYEEVILKLTHAPARTPRAALLLARALYMTGFEEFPRAKAIIGEFAPSDAECRALQETILKVDENKQKGNDLFSQKHFADSITFYSGAIELAANNGRVLRVLYCNRAAAYKEVGRFREGVEDCTKAISFDAKFCKAFARRARCLMGCQDYQSAVTDFKKACELEPSDMDLARELRYAERLAQDELAKEKDLYHVMGVAKTATAQEIKVRWRELSLKYHPDKCMSLPDVQRTEMERKFKVISEAYQTLSDPALRAKFDARDVPRGYAGMGGYGAAAAAYSDLFRNAAAHPNRAYGAGAAGGMPGGAGFGGGARPDYGRAGGAPPSFF